MGKSLISAVARELEIALEPITLAIDDPWWRERLLNSLGIDATAVDAGQLLTALATARDLATAVRALDTDDVSFEHVTAVLNSIRQAAESLRAIESSNIAGFEGLGRDFLQFLVSIYLRNAHPLLFDVGVLTTLISPASEDDLTEPVVSGDRMVRQQVALDRFKLDRLPDLLRDPVSTLATEYGPWATADDANACADKLFPRLASLLGYLDIPVMYGLLDAERELLGDAVARLDHSLTVFVTESASGPPADIGFNLALLSEAQSGPAMIISPFGDLQFLRKLDDLELSLDFTGNVEGVAFSPQGATIVASAPTSEVIGELSAKLAPDPDEPPLALGSPTGTRFELGGARVSIAMRAGPDEQEIKFLLAVSDAAFILSVGDGDGFVSSIGGGGDSRATFDLGLTWSNKSGLQLQGGTGLEANFPAGYSLGGLTLSTVHVGLRPTTDSVIAEASGTLRASFGPFMAVVERTGLIANLSFPDNGGNLGVADLDFGFKPPSGVGFTLKGGVLSGGGFLRFDPERGEYAGALELTFASVSLKAIVMLSTKVEGAPFALLAMVYARFPGGLELGMRFTLNAVGGMIGLNRGFDYQALVAGLPSGALDALLFPEDPVTDAPRILAALGSICPVRPGAYTLALMVEIGWGSDYICALRLGIVLPLDEMRHIYLIGQVRVTCFRHLPEDVRLQLICDTTGEIGFDPFSLRIDGRLRDSRFGPIGIEGQMVMVLTTGAEPRFLIAAGGFHPNFKNIPSGLPAKIDRLAVSYEVGRFKAWFKGYFAVAAGTLQFGADVGCRYKAGSLGFTGNLAIDALIHLEPFEFEAEVRFNAAVEYRGHELFGVHVKATLWGPDRWRIKGHGSFSILFWDVDVDFNESWGDDVLSAAEPIVLLDKAAEDLLNDTYWEFEASAAAAAVHVATSAQGAGSAVHPLTTLAYRQRRFPLGMSLDRVGSSPISGPRTVPIPKFFAADDSEIEGEPALEPFAAGEYVDLDDDARLTRPSFEALPAGVAAGISGYRLPEGPVVEAEVDYEEFFLPRLRRFEPEFHLIDLNPELIGTLMAHEAAGRSRVGMKARLAKPREPVRNSMPKWSAADLGTLRLVANEAPEWTSRAPSALAQARPGAFVPVETFELAA
jgi:hypothetical protein